ncbi:MAG TPA: serine/threonine-protein kinase, partial [Urbifossiella sp.]|nr:serine/threonine-protein kinase [Urbifossiella sp.]
MAERETATGPGTEPSAVSWAGKWFGSDRADPLLPVPPVAGGEPPTRSLDAGASTGVNTTALSVAPVRFGGLEILDKIGQGGMGAVYRARQVELNRMVALKVITPRSWDDSAARSRFEREFKSLAAIDHANIVPVYDAGSWEGLLYFTMKYVPGGALSTHLDRFRADPAAAARLMAKVARAVHRLHQAQVLHRDLKPHNILLG